MASWRARAWSTTLSILLHAILLWIVATWNVAPPQSEAADLERVIVSLAKPRPAPPAAVPAPAPPQPQPPAPEPEPPAPEKPEPQPESEVPMLPRQLVSPPDGGKELPPEDTRFFSTRDNVVEEQSKRPGEPAPSDDLDGTDIVESDPQSAPADTDTNAAAQKPPGEAPSVDPPMRDNGAPSDEPAEASRPRTDLASLMPNALKLAAEQAKNAPPTPRQSDAGGRQQSQRAAAWQPSTAMRGTVDNLPDVAPGNITLLNTKAQVFAPFVNRVFLRVLQNMTILLRRSASTFRPGAHELIEAEAVMSPEGRMIGLRITNRSATLAIGLDRMLQEACDLGFFDRNPPPGAAADDGNFHFLMQTVIQTYPSAGQRGIGFTGLFGVGLL